jgi:hypothetical protein
MKSSSLFVPLAVFALAAGLPAPRPARAQAPAPGPAPSPSPEPDARARFTGVFHYSGGPQERAALDAAIERAVSEFLFIIRPIVRGKLRDANTIAKQVTFQWAPGSMRVMFTDPPRDYRAPDDGTPVHDPASHDASTRISHRFDSGTFIESFTADDGAQRNLFTLTPDGQGLTMAATVSSPKLKVPVQYSLTYHK